MSYETFDDRRDHAGSLEGNVTRWIGRISRVSVVPVVFMRRRRHVRAM